MLEKLKLLLNKEDDSLDELLITLISMCKEDAVVYCNLKEYSNKLDNTVMAMVIERYNQMGAENIKDQTFSGVSASYFEFYSDRVVKMLNKFRKVRTL